MEKRFLASLTVSATEADAFAAALEPFAESTTLFEAAPDGSRWMVTSVLKPVCDRQALAGALELAALALGAAMPALDIAPLENRDWLALARADFPPFRIGKFYIHGSHHAPRPGDGPLRLKVDAGTAFGSGEHPTTRGCLMALQSLATKRAVTHALDMGCGSGILAMAIARLWHAPVLAVDIDPESVRVTRENARLNGVSSYIHAGAGNGYGAPILSRAAPFDVVVSNILARPLRRMAPRLARVLAPGGHAILSGLLDRQQVSVIAAHRAQGLRLAARYAIGEWVTLVMRN